MADDHDSQALAPWVFDGIHEVRMFEDRHKTLWVVATDICRVLGLDDVASAIRGLREREKGTKRIPTPGGTQMMSIISEQGMYRLLMRSYKPEAVRFQDWIVEEVIPAVRKTGTYTMPNTEPALPQPEVDTETVLPPRDGYANLEVSLPMALALSKLRSEPERWFSNQQLGEAAGVLTGTVKHYTRYWLKIGLINRQAVFPRHLYRLSPRAQETHAALWGQMDHLAVLVIQQAGG